MLNRKPWGQVPAYEFPPASFAPGELVQFERELPLEWIVLASTHTHTQIEGIPKAVPNWDLVRVRKSKNRK